ncbi:MAG: hypothetical protein ACE5HN_03525 [Nitrospiria bacterium]
MKRFCSLWIIPFGMIVSLTSPAFGKDIALHGIPTIQTRSSMEISHNVKLDGNQQLTNAVIITKEGDRYFWETRDRRELLLKRGKQFDLFIDPETGGYIKVIEQDGQFVYMEHISIKKLKAFTYWGKMIVYNP